MNSSVSASTTTKALTYLLTTLKRYHSELTQEKELIRKEKDRRDKIKQDIEERTLKWNKSLEEQDRLKLLYLRARKELEEEEAKLNDVNEFLTKYRGLLKSKQKLVNRKKKVALQAKAKFDSFYSRQLRLEKMAQRLIIELQHSNRNKAIQDTVAQNRQESITKNEETLIKINKDMHQVHQLLMDSLHNAPRSKSLKSPLKPAKW